MSPVRAVLLAVAALVLAARAGAETPAPAPPLTNEDVVKMVAGGTPEREILSAIRDRDEAFDLSGDMIEELTAAGVPESVLAAMRAKHVNAALAAPAPERTKTGHAALVVTINPGGTGIRSLRLPTWADEDVKSRYGLPKENDQRTVKDVAVFLACTSPEHIPDLWRSKTPLGRDLTGAVKHQMLVFVPGGTPEGKAPHLTLPKQIEGDVDATEPHDVILGVAALIGDRWVQLAFGKLGKVTVGPKPLVGRIDRLGEMSFKVELTAPR